MPRTIAAACAGVYEFVPAVWCTIASRTDGANVGVARTIFSSACHPERGTIAGKPASATSRGARLVTSDHSS